MDEVERFFSDYLRELKEAQVQVRIRTLGPSADAGVIAEVCYDYIVLEQDGDIPDVVIPISAIIRVQEVPRGVSG